MQINNYKDLIEFIELESVNFKQASEVVSKALGVIPISFDTSKDKLIENVKSYIDRWKDYEGELPLFLCQKELQFNIKDVCKM